jgi:hypothetical protein
MNADFVEIERLKRLLQSADQSVNDIEADNSKTQVDFAKERTQFFEKLAIGSGATIAAIVSFLGVHAGKLQPEWIMRCSLISLVVAMVAALCRNFLYPFYVLAVNNVSWINAKLYQQQRKKECFRAEPEIRSWQSGEPIDAQLWIAEAEKAEADMKPIIQKRQARHERLWRAVKISETVCIVAVSVAMISLVWLALRNF